MSQAFVIVVILIYAAIFLNALALGKNGAFTRPAPSPAPSAEVSPGASGLGSPGASVTPSGAPAAS